jgi:hypothetical protein
MSQNMDSEIADMRQEIQDLEKAIVQRNPPLHPRVRAVAEAKIAKLRDQIAVVKRGRLTTPSE